MNNPLKLNPRERMWRVARCMLAFSVADLATIGSAKESQAMSFAKCLSRRGYVVTERFEKQPHRGRPQAKFRLVKNPGPILPADLRGYRTTTEAA
jgi:predicted ArsR family transcriptional regulator